MNTVFSYKSNAVELKAQLNFNNKTFVISEIKIYNLKCNQITLIGECIEFQKLNIPRMKKIGFDEKKKKHSFLCYLSFIHRFSSYIQIDLRNLLRYSTGTIKDDLFYFKILIFFGNIVVFLLCLLT